MKCEFYAKVSSTFEINSRKVGCVPLGSSKSFSMNLCSLHPLMKPLNDSPEEHLNKMSVGRNSLPPNTMLKWYFCSELCAKTIKFQFHTNEIYWFVAIWFDWKTKIFNAKLIVLWLLNSWQILYREVVSCMKHFARVENRILHGFPRICCQWWYVLTVRSVEKLAIKQPRKSNLDYSTVPTI